MRRVTVETPATYERPAAAVDYSRRAVVDALYRGEAPYTATVLYEASQALDVEVPQERALGILAGLTWAGAAETTAVYMDYGITATMREAILEAGKAGRPVEYRAIGRNP